MTATSPVVCAGRVYADLVFTGIPSLPRLGEEIYAEGLSVVPGGGAAITAAYLSALGCDAQLLTWLPAPPFAPAMRSQLGEAGIALDLCSDGDGDPQITVAMATGGDRAFLTRRSGPAVPGCDAGEFQRLGARHLHIGELATLVEAPWLLEAAREARLSVSLDCAWDPEVFHPASAPLIAGVDVFLPNAAEVDALGTAGLDPFAAPLTVVKQGSDGATANIPERRIHAVAEASQAIDSTGAGDAFNAGFLIAWLDGESLETCLAAGNAAGARAVVTVGGMPA